MTRPCPRQLLAAPLEQLLVSGSDTRSAVDPRTGLNRFGCAPLPRPEALSFGSSTASSISAEAFRRVREERDGFLESSRPGDDIDGRMEALREELKSLLGLAPTEAEVVFAPSGTDSVLHALFLARALSRNGAEPMECILVASDETGTGVPRALSGRHFGTVTAEGVPVTPGGAIAGLSENVTLLPLPMCDPERMDREVSEAVTRSVAAGRRVLLQVMDGSKLGARSPSSDCLQSLQTRFPEAMTVVVDACQLRTSLARLVRHLDQGRLVLISGSKFFTGPPFSGALLVPSSLSRGIRGVRAVPPGLCDYTNRTSWPRAWESLRAALPDRDNFGQYFRWAAALEEMHRYFAVPQEFRRTALCRFSAMAAEVIRGRAPEFLLLGDSPPPLEDWEDASEMGARTIFPFVPWRGDRWQSFEEATALYHALPQDLTGRWPRSLDPGERALAATPCHLGQPVRVAPAGGGKMGALRLCAGARTVSQLWSARRAFPEAVLLDQARQEITTVLDKIALVMRRTPP